MAIRYWKRMREKAADPGNSLAPTPNPWQDEDSEQVIDLNLSDLERGDLERDGHERDGHERDGLSADERQAQYSDWADRMHQKRQRNRDAINAARTKPTQSNYWSTEALFADSKLVEEDELTSRPNPWRVQELLSLLELNADAAPEDVGDAYRRLAKQHHPDRFAGADTETQQLHADKMMSINKAYRALKELQRA